MEEFFSSAREDSSMVRIIRLFRLLLALLLIAGHVAGQSSTVKPQEDWFSHGTHLDLLRFG